MHKHVFVIYLLMCSASWHILMFSPWNVKSAIVWLDAPTVVCKEVNRQRCGRRTVRDSQEDYFLFHFQRWWLQSVMFHCSQRVQICLTHTFYKMAGSDPQVQLFKGWLSRGKFAWDLRGEFGFVQQALVDWVSLASGKAAAGRNVHSFHILCILIGTYLV